MSEIDLPRRLDEYGAVNLFALSRIALIGADVADPDLPSFDVETKCGDPRARWYRATYGTRCWELDALSPVVLRERVEAAIVARLDRPVWDRYVEAERVERESIVRTVSKWGELTAVPR